VGHLDENAILELLEHRMSPERRAAAEKHLDRCPSCLELLALLAADAPIPMELGPTELDVTRHVVAALLSPGDRLGRFVLERVVGEGGMGVVWAARDDAGSLVALKILKEVSPAERKRFLREAALMQGFDHPGIVDVKEVLPIGDDVVLVMDLLEGESLGARLSRVGSLDVAATVAILAPLLDAVAAAHARGVVHRDLKPGNVFLQRDGRVRLGARRCDDRRERAGDRSRSKRRPIQGQPDHDKRRRRRAASVALGRLHRTGRTLLLGM
jgi:serine/threonine-protein kinase